MDTEWPMDTSLNAEGWAKPKEFDDDDFNFEKGGVGEWSSDWSSEWKSAEE